MPVGFAGLEMENTTMNAAPVRKTPERSSGSSGLMIALRIAFLLGFFLAAALLAFLTFALVRDFVAGWKMTNLPGVTVRDATPTPGPGGAAPGTTPEVPLMSAGPTPPPWNGAQRISMLIMGLDYRDWEAGQGPPRTDTMILLTIDPIHRTAGILSIPRDLWVNIPGFDYGRINTAYSLGEAYKVPGGGPQLAADTVEELLGVPIDYYAQVDFGAFVQFIDEIGGVEVDITEPLKLDPMGDGKKGNVKNMKPGHYTLPGELALAYVRLRKTEGGDFDRAQRQQQVILSIRKRILEFNMMPTLISKAPALYNEISSGVNTNLSLDDAIRLAWLAAQIPEENIKRGAIGTDQITFAKSPDGAQDVLKPLTEKVRALRDEIFSDTGPASPISNSMSIAELVKAEGARVSVVNGSSSSGLASRTAEYLKSQGVNVVDMGNANQLSSGTEITYYTGKPYTLKFLVDLMKISPFRIHHLFDPTKPVDIQITVGEDWAQTNTMP
jgi:polyisoprenyl-teichoic acid--peptidoglycan teichoic acid transferase